MRQNDMEKKSVVKKVCLLGDGSVGKTSLIRRFVDDTFSEEYLVTIECNISTKQVSVEDESGNSAEMRMAIWDIMGHKGLTKLHKSYFTGAKGGLIVCDLTRKDTLESLDTWIEPFFETVGVVPIVILANKADLKGEEELGTTIEKVGM